MIATAIYVTGTARLEPGRRYGIGLRGSQLLILGPTDLNPSTVALERPVGDIEVSAVQGRLLVSEPRNRSGLVLAFMAVAGPGLDDLAGIIRTAARQHASP